MIFHYNIWAPLVSPGEYGVNIVNYEYPPHLERFAPCIKPADLVSKAKTSCTESPLVPWCHQCGAEAQTSVMYLARLRLYFEHHLFSPIYWFFFLLRDENTTPSYVVLLIKHEVSLVQGMYCAYGSTSVAAINTFKFAIWLKLLSGVLKWSILTLSVVAWVEEDLLTSAVCHSLKSCLLFCIYYIWAFGYFWKAN